MFIIKGLFFLIVVLLVLLLAAFLILKFKPALWKKIPNPIAYAIIGILAKIGIYKGVQ